MAFTTPITTSQNPALLLADLGIVWSNFNVLPKMWEPFYEKRTSHRNFELVQEMATLPRATYKPEAEAMKIQSMGQTYQTQFNMKVWTSAFQITREMLDDNQYDIWWPQGNRQMRNAIETLLNIQAMAPINNAFNPLVPTSDGQPLLSTQHPISNGVQANTFTNFTGFNESSLKDMLTMMRFTLNYAGEIIQLLPERLLGSPNLEFDFREVLGNPEDGSTANRALGTIHHGNYIPGGYMTNAFITIPTFWSIMTNQSPGLLFYERDGLEITWQGDMNVGVTTFKGRIRFSNGPANWRCIFGSA